jgi:Zn-dependent protease/CBS domain-containing protein
MFKSHFRLGKVFGIPVNIDASWLLIFIWVTWSLAGSYFPQHYPSWSTALTWGVAVVTSLLFFSSVLLHELGHSLVARSQGTPVSEITLFIFGGVAQITEEPSTPAKELRMALVGPLISLLLSALFGALYLATRSVSLPLSAAGLFLAGANLSLGLFNLIPGFPLDGGRVLRAILWAARRDLARATRWASWVGQAVAYLFILSGVVRAFGGDWVGGIWIAFIGFFLDNAARSTYYQLTLHKLLDGHVVGEIMTQDCVLLPPQLTLDVLVEQYLLTKGQRCFSVGTRERVLGLLTVHNVSTIPKERWPTTHVADVLTPLDQLRVVAPITSLWVALQQMTKEGVNQLPVLEDGALLGMVTREGLLTFIRNRSQLGI